MMKDVFVATITNLFYGLAGVAMWQYDASLMPAAVAAFVLMLGSGYHHYHLQPWSRKYDFIAMYLVLSTLLFVGMTPLPAVILLLSAVGVSVVLYLGLGSSRAVVGVLIGLLVLAILYLQSFLVAPVLEIGAVMAVAFVFNLLGESSHKEEADFVHGLGWHAPSALAVYMAGVLVV